jgi:hypothetical protein
VAVNVTGDPCGAAVTLGFPTVHASVVCSGFDSTTCSGSASVTGLTIFGLISAALIESTATAPTDPGNCEFKGTINIVRLNVLGTEIAADGSTNQAVIVDALGLQATVLINSQVCENGELTVAAVKVTITGIGTNVVLTIAESTSFTTCCSCPGDSPGGSTTTTSSGTGGPTSTVGGNQGTTTTVPDKRQLAVGDPGDDPSVAGDKNRAPGATPVRPGDVTFTG